MSKKIIIELTDDDAEELIELVRRLTTALEKISNTENEEPEYVD